jgi:hypothetical protein
VPANVSGRPAAVVATVTLIVLPAISAASLFVILNRRILSDAAVALAAGVAIVSAIASVLSVRSMALLDDSAEQ